MKFSFLVLTVFLFFFLTGCAPRLVTLGIPIDRFGVESTRESTTRELLNSPEKIVSVITTGVGENRPQAIENASEIAVQEVVGQYIISKEVVKNDELIQDKILTQSNGFVKDFKILDERKDEDGLVHVKAEVQVLIGSLTKNSSEMNVAVEDVRSAKFLAASLDKLDSTQEFRDMVHEVIFYPLTKNQGAYSIQVLDYLVFDTLSNQQKRGIYWNRHDESRYKRGELIPVQVNFKVNLNENYISSVNQFLRVAAQETHRTEPPWQRRRGQRGRDEMSYFSIYETRRPEMDRPALHFNNRVRYNRSGRQNYGGHLILFGKTIYDNRPNSHGYNKRGYSGLKGGFYDRTLNHVITYSMSNKQHEILTHISNSILNQHYPDLSISLLSGNEVFSNNSYVDFKRKRERSRKVGKQGVSTTQIFPAVDKMNGDELKWYKETARNQAKSFMKYFSGIFYDRNWGSLPTIVFNNEFIAYCILFLSQDDLEKLEEVKVAIEWKKRR